MGIVVRCLPSKTQGNGGDFIHQSHNKLEVDICLQPPRREAARATENLADVRAKAKQWATTTKVRREIRCGARKGVGAMDRGTQ
jgi:hypothetical protein